MDRFYSARERPRNEQLIKKLKRSGFLPPSAPAAMALVCEADQGQFRVVICLFRAVIHVLHLQLPEVRQINYNLRPRAHGFRLHPKDGRNFIPRLLFKDMYCSVVSGCAYPVYSWNNHYSLLLFQCRLSAGN